MEGLTLKPGDPGYPQRLRERVPDATILHASGPLAHLSRWTMAFVTADVEPGAVTRAVWDMFFPVLEYEMNLIGGWRSVNEGVLFRSALEKPWISLTLFTCKGLDTETWESFISERHPKPADYFLQRPEYDRRAAAGELLMLSAAPQGSRVQTRDAVMQRNWLACMLADVVFIGGAEKLSKQWSVDKKKLVGKRQKTYTLARSLVKSKVPVFTVDHPDNKDLFELGVPGLTPKALHAFLAPHGANLHAESSPSIAPPRHTVSGVRNPRKGPEQLDLFSRPPRKKR